MNAIRTRKEREAIFDRSYIGNLKPHQREAWLERFVVEDLLKLYQSKVLMTSEKVAKIINQIDLIEEKILSASDKSLISLSRELNSLTANRSDYEMDVEYYTNVVNNLSELDTLVDRLIDRERFVKVVRIIPEHRLEKMAKDDKSMQKLSELITKLLNKMRNAAQRQREHISESEIQRTQEIQQNEIHQQLSTQQELAAAKQKQAELKASREASNTSTLGNIEEETNKNQNNNVN